LYAAAPRPDLKAAIGREVAELDVLVDEILLASRLDHDGDMEPPEPVDLLALAAEEAARAGVELRAVEAGAGPFELRGWPRLLRRMIRNLVQNAVQHGGPPVEIELGRDDGDGAPRITLAVHDRCTGIPDEERERVFEPFHRPRGRPEAEGSWGLGLALVRQIAERHGGAVACKTRPDGGTSFLVELPG
jgi:signal transduction histidine kinase